MSNSSRQGSGSNRRGGKSSKAKKDMDDLIGKERQYQELNAELEAKTANLVREAEEVMKEQAAIFTGKMDDAGYEIGLSRSRLLDNINPDDFLEEFNESQTPYESYSKVTSYSQSVPSSSHGRPPPAARPKSCSAKQISAKQLSVCDRIRSSGLHMADDVAVPDECYLTELHNTFHQISNQHDGTDLIPGIDSAEFDDVLPPTANEMGSEATIRFLKAKLRVMQEELEKLSLECNAKEDDKGKLQHQVKQLEEERGRLQRTTTSQQSQIDKYKKLCDDGRIKTEGLENQVMVQKRELDELKRNSKKDNTSHKATEVRLNRALEEIERYKEQLQKTKTEAKDHSGQDKKRVEQLTADNRHLEKQKNELMTGFRKQLKLIDILKKQKMHIEASKMLSFTEEEFVKAMEWET